MGDTEADRGAEAEAPVGILEEGDVFACELAGDLVVVLTGDYDDGAETVGGSNCAKNEGFALEFQELLGLAET